MQFPESWLREFCNPPLNTAQLADALTMGGLEVEEVRPVAPPFTGVVVGQIVEATPHPNADRLRVCTVDIGQISHLTIVCGAPNARAGIKVPCAIVGAELPPGDDGKPFSIRLGKLRGVESQGMLCSARELKVSEEHGGLLELAANAALGRDVRDLLRLDDAVFTLKLTPNLGHALSVYGIAREVAAITGAPLMTPTIQPVTATHADRLPVRIDAPDLCGRFVGRIVRNIDAGAATPAWMVDRLARCGQRSVNALVDISNYVMFEYGRPSHIFDLDKIQGGLEVRWGRTGETLKLLNGNTITVDEQVGVIADSQQIESLAGIMGGDASAVSDATRHVYLEAAFWWPDAVAGRSRRFNFATDAGHRFERGVDPATAALHVEHITRLILNICGGDAGLTDDTVLDLPPPTPVALRIDRAARVIGMPLSQAQCADALSRLGLPLTQAPGVVTVTPPAYRFDLRIEADLIEEVARLVGYEHLPTTPPLAPVLPRPQHEARRSAFTLRRTVAALGYQETIGFSFVEEQWERELVNNLAPVRLLNPIASPLAVMRSSLLGSLLQALKFNLDRKAERVRLFEIGRVFLRDPSVVTTHHTVAGVHQPMRLTGVAYGSADALQWAPPGDRRVDFFDAKGDIEALLAPRLVQFRAAQHPAMHPGRCAEIVVDGESIGHVGELHPRWRQSWGFAQVPVLFELSLDAALQRQVPVFEPIARFPTVERDIALVVTTAVTHAGLMSAILAAPTGGLLRDATLFDVYPPYGEARAGHGLAGNERSLAVRLTMQSDTSTLADAQIEAVVQAVTMHVATAVHARLRT